MMKGSERGVTLPLTALFLVVLFVFAALAIDLGIAFTARTSAQHVADAAALARSLHLRKPDRLPANRSPKRCHHYGRA